jgi:hypothetical protein
LLRGAVEFSCRSFGKLAGMPLIFLRHFSGYMDSCDRAVVNALAECSGEWELVIDLDTRRIAFLASSDDQEPRG